MLLLLEREKNYWTASYLYKNGPAPEPLAAGDTNSDTIVDISDVVYLVNYLFKGGNPPE